MKLISSLVLVVAGVTAIAQDPGMMMAPPKEVKQLSWMLGTWTGTNTSNMSGTPEKAACTVKTEWSCGGRFLKTTFSTKMMGSKFEGVQMTTFNPESKEWTTIWFDSMTPQDMHSKGTIKGNTITFISDPMPMPDGSSGVFRSQWTKMSNTHMTFRLDMKQGEEWSKLISGSYRKK